ncbi:MBL fold metallo-hydrolase [Aliigemmobacter aestuarii]|uniref:MBL fold metallo-hydrolase n=2 Tax=Aliigemmobacter aestuarii TaxID=1445661 RepID=A0A4S3MTI5_9RHOB|nr:MBL fold metallo-hydrolase [Gemmobacter aestuarii]
MTHWGTNTFLLGEGGVIVIDPGPDSPAHLAALLAALEPGEEVAAIVVTHAHLDHSPLARALKEATGAPVLAFGGASAGRSPVMRRLAEAGLAGGGEGVDAAFHPDRSLADGETVAAGGVRIEALHTPGHFAGHLCLAWGDRLFSGDHVMGWASSLVSPPDGDMGAFMRSLDRLATRGWRRFYPAHGAPVDDPAARIAELIRHRRAREAALLTALAKGPATVEALATQVYADTPAPLMPAARRNALAHLIDLWERNLVQADPELSLDARFSLI